MHCTTQAIKTSRERGEIRLRLSRVRLQLLAQEVAIWRIYAFVISFDDASICEAIAQIEVFCYFVANLNMQVRLRDGWVLDGFLQHVVQQISGWRACSKGYN